MARAGTIDELTRGVTNALAVSRVFGEPIERDGITVIPVASVAGGGGGGGGGTDDENGSGGGFGLGATPVGVYVIKDGQVSWQPAIDVNKIIARAQLMSLVLLLAVRRGLKRRAKRK